MIINEIIQIRENVGSIAVFYGGRFQPMHQGHRDVYKHLVTKFGADNVFIATTFSQKATKHTQLAITAAILLRLTKRKVSCQLCSAYQQTRL